MHQYWFFIGDFPIRAYGTIFALAFIIGVGITLYFAKAEGHPEYIDLFMDLAPILLISGIIGARFWQVFFSIGDFTVNILVKSWRSGMADFRFKGAWSGRY